MREYDELIDFLVPDNVRASGAYDQLKPGEAEESISDSYDLALLGVPEHEEFLEKSEELLESRSFNDIYVKPEYEAVIEELDVEFEGDIGVYDYEEEPSRCADLEAISELHDPEDNLMLSTWSYNVQRTGSEASNVLDLEGKNDGYHLEFPSFESMELGDSSIRDRFSGLLYTVGDSLPFTEPVFEPLGDIFSKEISLEGEPEYEVPEPEDAHYVVAGVPWSDDPDEIAKRYSMESFKQNSLPGWQKAKDYAKKPGRRITDGFDF